MTADPALAAPLARRLRRGLLLVAALIVGGTALELVFQHHWTSLVQLVAWAALLLLAAGVALAWRNPDRRAARAVRVLAMVVGVAALFGFYQHVLGNYDAAPLDAVYGEQWESYSEPHRWWLAFIQAVGPSPALAPGVLVLASLCLWLASPVPAPSTGSSDRSTDQT